MTGKELNNKNSDEKIVMLKALAEPNDWNNLPISLQRGTAYYQIEVEEKIKDLSEEVISFYIKQNKELSDTVIRNRWLVDYNIPIFSETKDFIEKRVVIN